MWSDKKDLQIRDLEDKTLDQPKKVAIKNQHNHCKANPRSHKAEKSIELASTQPSQIKKLFKKVNYISEDADKDSYKSLSLKHIESTLEVSHSI